MTLTVMTFLLTVTIFLIGSLLAFLHTERDLQLRYKRYQRAILPADIERLERELGLDD